MSDTDELRERIASAFRSLNQDGGTLADLDEDYDVYTLADVAATAARQVLDTPNTDTSAVLRKAADVVEHLPVPNTSPGWVLGASWALAQIRRLANDSEERTP